MSQNSLKELTQTILTIIRNQHPQTVNELALLAERETSIPRTKILKHITYLQTQGRITLKKPTTPPSRKLATYIRTENAHWYWIINLLIFTTTLVVFVVPEEAYPLVYIRYILGTVFVVWLPGYSLTRALFPQTQTKEKRLDIVERLALSIGLSLALTPLIGLLLNYTPWGIRLTPITLSLVAFTATFATAALVREHHESLQTGR